MCSFPVLPLPDSPNTTLLFTLPVALLKSYHKILDHRHHLTNPQSTRPVTILAMMCTLSIPKQVCFWLYLFDPYTKLLLLHFLGWME
jgi:hypothetical protein